MSEINIKQQQNELLKILLFFDSFCKKNKLKYFLGGGCLIGAVRHKGFIPWDDDIDIFMPRPDYEKLKKIWGNKILDARYAFCITDQNVNYHDAGASIRNIKTTFINSHSKNENIVHGLGIEIMPLDGCPKSTFSRVKQLYNAFIYNLFNVQRLPDNKGNLIRFFAKLIYKLVPSPKLRYLIWKNAEKKMSKYDWDECDEITELVGAIHGMLIRHPKTDFSEVVYLDFERTQLPVMIGYKNYLTKIWGDYMKLPPVESRVAKHDTVFIDLENPYLKYKGIYYCTKGE